MGLIRLDRSGGRPTAAVSRPHKADLRLHRAPDHPCEIVVRFAISVRPIAPDAWMCRRRARRF